MMRNPRRRIDPTTEQAIKESVRKAFSSELMRLDAEHEAVCRRLLGHLDSFERGGEDGRPGA